MTASNQRYSLMQHVPMSVNVVLFILITLIIAWNHFAQFKYYQTTQIEIMEQATVNASSDLSNYLDDTRLNIESFVIQEATLITAITNASKLAIAKQEFSKKIENNFPHSIGYILLDADGHLLNNGLIKDARDLSILDIRNLNNARVLPSIKIDRQGDIDYYSIYSRLVDQYNAGKIVGIAFKTELLQPILIDHQHANHQLLLWRHNVPGFVELAANQSNFSLNREYYLDNDDMQRVGAITTVKGTEWDVVALHAPSLFINKLKELIKTALIQLGLCALLLLLAVFYINSQLKQRFLSSKRFFEKEQRLSLALQSTRDGVWEFDLIKKTVSFEDSWLDIVKPVFIDNNKTVNINDWLSLIHPDDVQKTEQLLTSGLDSSTTYFENEHRLLTENNAWIWVLDRGQVFARDGAGNPTKLIGTSTNITSRKNVEQSILDNELALSEFYQIISSPNIELQERISLLLTLGCNHLGMKCGIISFVEGQRYTVLHVKTCSEKYNINVGDVFDFGITYCQFTIKQNKTIGFSHAAKTDIAKHPSYRELKLEAYLGSPIIVNNKAYGTLNFTSIEPREKEFSDSEKYFVRIMADWVTGELEKQHAEKSKRAIDRKLAFHIENSPFAVIEWSSDLRAIKWSQRAEQVLGWNKTQVLNKEICKWPLVSSEQRNILDCLESSLASQDVGSNMFTQEMITATGEIIHTEWFVTHLLNNEDQVIGLQSVVLDVSKRVLAEQALIRNQAKLEDLYENAPDMYFSIDIQGNITSANQVSHSTLGYQEGVLIGMPFWNLIDPIDVRRTKRHIDVVFADQINEFEMEVKIRKTDGTTINTHQRLRLILTSQNTPEELRILCRDVTERTKSQEDRLQHVQIQRDEISREVQHRIKNSLQAVVGLLKINLDTYPELKEVLVTSIGQVNTIAIVNNLMMGTQDESVKIQSLIERIIEASTKLFSKKVHVHVANKSIHELSLWEEETIAVSLVISELITNAMKHSEVAYDGTDIYVQVEVSIDNDQRLRLAISNQVIDQSKLSFIHNKDTWSGAGLAIMESLLPPKGAELFFDKNDNVVTSGLYLSAPVIMERQIQPLISVI